MRKIKFRALFKVDGQIYEVLSIDFLNKEATLWDKETAVNFEASFEDIELFQFAPDIPITKGCKNASGGFEVLGSIYGSAKISKDKQ